MRLLRLVGSGDDGTALILESVDADGAEGGERFTLPLDDRLRAATAATTEPADAPVPTPTSGQAPSPREIQVRVRAGETAQAIADEAGISLERVMRFAYPVLQERVRVTDEARRARARRGGDGLLVPFGDLIDSRLANHRIDPAVVRWDAFRREDGGWTVIANFTSFDRDVQAKFSFALMNRTVSALDDIAADLLSDRPVKALLPPPAPEPVAEQNDSGWEPDWDAAAPPRLTAVPNGPGAPRPQEATPAVRPPSRRQKAHTRAVPVSTDDELFDQDAFVQQPWHEPPLPFEVAPTAVRTATAPADATPEPGREQAADTADTADTARPRPAAEQPGRQVADSVDAVLDPASPVPAVGAEPAGTEVATAEPASAEGVGGDQPQKRARRSGEKPRMPSWDDILLGVRHKSD